MTVAPDAVVPLYTTGLTAPNFAVAAGTDGMPPNVQPEIDGPPVQAFFACVTVKGTAIVRPSLPIHLQTSKSVSLRNTSYVPACSPLSANATVHLSDAGTVAVCTVPS